MAHLIHHFKFLSVIFENILLPISSLNRPFLLLIYALLRLKLLIMIVYMRRLNIQVLLLPNLICMSYLLIMQVFYLQISTCQSMIVFLLLNSRNAILIISLLLLFFIETRNAIVLYALYPKLCFYHLTRHILKWLGSVYSTDYLMTSFLFYLLFEVPFNQWAIEVINTS